MSHSTVDVVVIGGGPAGLQAALTLARGQRRAVVFDTGPARNARAHHVNNFLTRDGTPPAAMRAIAREELAAYGVPVEAARVEGIDGERGRFRVRLEGGAEVGARRVILAVGMVDRLPELPGLDTLWGETVFQCPFCHGHALRGRRWAVFAPVAPLIEVGALIRAWSDDVVVLTDGQWEVPDELRARLQAAGIGLDERRVVGLRAAAEGPDRLGAIAFADGETLPRDALVFRPPQRQTPLVSSLGLAVDAAGFVAVDERRQTSRPGVYAAGDLATMMQAALGAAVAGLLAASAVIHDLTSEDFPLT